MGKKPTAMEASEEGSGTAMATIEPTFKYRGWKTMPFLIGNETFEKLSTLGLASNLIVYLTSIFHLSSVTAATTMNVFNGTVNMATVVGAFLSDSYLGRYTTVGLASLATLLGMFIITLTAWLPDLHPPPCDAAIGEVCQGPTQWQITFMVISFACLVVGSGGIRPCNLPFGADQFDPSTASGQRGINSFFSWYFFTFTISVAISSTIIVYIQTNLSWALGFAIPTIFMLVSCAFFFVGSNIYVKVPPEGSPFSNVAKVLVAAFRKRRLKLPDDPKLALFNPPHVSSIVSKLPYTDQFKFLDKAAILDENKADEKSTSQWNLCSIQHVEEVKCLIRIIPIWSTGIIYFIAIAQQTNYVILQALQSDRHFGKSKIEIPAGSFNIFSMLALTIWIPIYDRIIIPLLKKSKGEITLLHRMGIGLIIGITSVVVTGLVEEKRRSTAFHHLTLGRSQGGGAISAFSSFWLVPQLLLLGLSEAFNHVSQLEFYYKQFPENMRSVAGALLFCGIAISSYVSGLMVTLVNRTTTSNDNESWLAQDLNKGRLDKFYYLIGGLGAINFFYFLARAKWYRYKVVRTALFLQFRNILAPVLVLLLQVLLVKMGVFAKTKYRCNSVEGRER